MFARRLLAVLISLVTAVATVVVVAPTADARTPRTIKKIVRPVHRNGTPVKGWRVVSSYDGGEYYTCFGQSPVAVNSGIDWCGGTADNTIACWRSARHTVLCLRDPRKRELVRVTYTGAYKRARAYQRPSPQALVLAKYGVCSVRLGGAWDTAKQHPSWYGYYSCTRGRSYSAVYGPGSRRDGIIYRKHKRWQVDLLRYSSDYEQLPMKRDSVRVAYYVGTAT